MNLSRRDKALLAITISPLVVIGIAYFLMVAMFSCGAAKFLNDLGLVNYANVRCLCGPAPVTGCFP
jgi:hypothetical protein